MSLSMADTIAAVLHREPASSWNVESIFPLHFNLPSVLPEFLSVLNFWWMQVSDAIKHQ
jgi:hypothetical protein